MPAIEVTLTTDPPAFFSSLNRPRPSRIGAKKLTWNTVRHSCMAVVRLNRGVRRSSSFWADAGIVDERVEPGAVRLQPLADFLGGKAEILGIGQVDLNMVFRPHRPGTLVGKGLPGTGDHPPAFRGKPLDGGMADPAACTGQHKSVGRSSCCEACRSS